MKIKKIDMKKAAVSCTAICLAGALCWSGNSMTAWAAPTSGTAINDNTRVRSAIGGNPIGSLKANQEVTIKGEQTSGDGYTWYEITFDWNGAETDGWVRSDMISSGTGAATKDDTSDQADSSDASDTAGQTTEAQDGTFQIAGKTYELADTFPNAEIPTGFEATTITYAGENVSAAKMEQGDVILLYLQNTENSGEKDVFVYDTERDEAVPFVSIDVQDSFVVVTNVPEDVAAEISDYYQETTCAFSEGSIMAYQGKTDGNLTDPNASVSDFYYVYGTNSQGESGWYTYDSAGQTIQRSIANMQYQENAGNAEGTDQAENNSVFELDSMTRMLTAGLGIVALLLLILFIVTSVRYHRLRKYLDTEEFPEEEDEAEEDDLFDDTTIGVDIVGSTVDIVDFDGDTGHSAKNKKKAKKAEKKKKSEAATKEESAVETPVEGVPEEPAKDVSVKEIFSGENDSSEKVVSEETEKLVADLKKMIQEVETTMQPDDEEDEFYDEEDPEEVEPVQEKKKDSRSGKGDSWDDIEFL